MEAIRTNKTNTKKEAMLEALERSLGIVTTACNAVGIGRTTHYQWMKDDPEYRQAVKDIDNRTLDFAESHLHKLIKEGNPAATIFFLKTKGKATGTQRSQTRMPRLRSVGLCSAMAVSSAMP